MIGAGTGFTFAAILNLIKQYNRKQQDPNYQFDWKSFLSTAAIGAGVGAVCGVLPDILEPATSPGHRKFFHSLTTASAISFGMYKLKDSSLSEEEKNMLSTAGVSYLSHLLLDSATPFGLPLVA